MPFAQLVIGPPGSGKSTYCAGMHQFMSAIGRKCQVVNLDPANDATPYPCALDVRNLVTLDEVMDENGLGPNGGIVYALEELEENMDWLEESLTRFGEDYIIFDSPGQVELFTHHNSLRNIVTRLEKLGYRLVVIHLLDSHHLASASQYISILLTALRSMLLLPLPHLNVLSKMDLLRNHGPLPFNLDFYTDAQDLPRLLPHVLATEQGSERFAKLNEAICDLVDSFGLVGFETLAVEDKASMTHLLQAIDRAGGYAFGAAEGAGDNIWTVAMRERWGEAVGGVMDVQERWVDARDEYDEFERVRERRLQKDREREWRRKRREEGEYVDSDSDDSDEDGGSTRGAQGGDAAVDNVKVVER
ncbi:GPN-loop GTPase-like 2 [Drechslerella stenobrocha 248]|uniref:GPN-loop GTPase 2 n=1 Tax=Drechslerella stenobrocha 248 TaxID=1043628 RepID=W7HUN9_9PEZI|nr:GPN-loop GTPase-like 2 [Drechslerella stenobrocha 248]